METNERNASLPAREAENKGTGELRCGAIVPRSGIYEVVHPVENGTARGASHVIALRGERVGPCQCCGEDVQLRLMYAAPHISEDGDFAADQLART